MLVLGQRERCLRKRSGKGSFTGVGCTRDAKPAPPDAPGSIVDQKRLKPCCERPLIYQASRNRRGKTEIPD